MTWWETQELGNPWRCVACGYRTEHATSPVHDVHCPNVWYGSRCR